MRKKLLCGLALSSLAAAALAQSAGAERLRSMQEALQRGDVSTLPADTRSAAQAGMASARAVGDRLQASTPAARASTQAAAKWDLMARDAFVAALPRRDQERGRSLLLGNGTDNSDSGRLYVFVSRSMPMSLLRAYSVDAFYAGASLVLKGIRKGSTIKEYMLEAVSDFNSADGQIMAGMDINPNLYDQFQIDVVPTVVWTNRVGLDDVGVGCPKLPEGVPAPKVTVRGPDDEAVEVERPTCAPMPSSSYFKIAGAVNLQYVLDRFQDAGAPKAAMDYYRQLLAARSTGAVAAGQQPEAGSAMAPIDQALKLTRMPQHVLQSWRTNLATKMVQRSAFGPVFSTEGEDDPAYRQELQRQIEQGLGPAGR